ncbi:hypothetical protein BGI05_02310 [Snodgrassella alvi]|uniref:hypothetical protein n=1 Tax=Snodgrassella alvi TaxID=1196083 RepID=UPI0009FED0AE|nr:hypothetical protein [Snodgrassella alvi]ORF03577.1 hypothetical protein BGH97_02410 [Snodgrassella alvi]ORF09740.1 hypothetical protein BGH99_01260 [Snodgrassella alvi]ORF14730.1 hypothetical protein BGI00_01960 [Snodgrassella alvi]ORF16313.1 hypothetical protein BGI02_00765 [Snodgrassella alvi]ORF22360.1 hypothetical protein BGI05_02310 [Snodgrassella alvi]
MKQQTSVTLDKPMILGTDEALSVMQFHREENGGLMLEVGQINYPIQNNLTFNYQGVRCSLQINKQQNNQIDFSLVGQQKLLLIIQQ